MGVGTLFTANDSLVVEAGLVVEGVALVVLAGVVGLLSSSFFADLGVAAGLGVELFSLPLFLPEVGVLGVVFTCIFKKRVNTMTTTDFLNTLQSSLVPRPYSQLFSVVH